ncbi:MAG: polysulfide reductase NrfD [Chloroflexi bacterium]|nr:polysulfide reductase NrfD [Chloroflexota bacterium]
MTEQAYPRAWENRRARTERAKPVGYYGLPVIHRPHWKWEIVLYFFFGGIAAGSYIVATIAALFGGAAGREIARAGRYVSLAALLPSPILLILDLGRPERFYNMFRVFKLRSPMSVGTWGLLAFSGFSALSAAIQAAEDGLFGQTTAPARLLRTLSKRLIGVLGLGPAFFVGGYTGVLLAATAVPLWTKSYLIMGPLFLTSAFSSATAAIAIVLAASRRANPIALQRLERLDALALVAELALLVVLRRNLSPTVARPLDEGRLGRLHRTGVLGAGIAAPLALQVPTALLGRYPSRVTTGLASVLTLAGGLLLRYVMINAGKRSADDPAATLGDGR